VILSRSHELSEMLAIAATFRLNVGNRTASGVEPG
jgi:hypothetical protein